MPIQKRRALRNDRRENIARPERRIDQPIPDWRVEQRYARDYFERRAARLPIVTTTRTPHGQILDWIDPQSQVLDGKLAVPPPPLDVHLEKDRPEHLAQFE